MTDKDYLQQALNLAKESLDRGGFPAGALVVLDQKVIGEGISLGNILHDPTSHAEVAAIRQACQKLQTTSLTGATLYESLECCTMCFSACNWAGISRIVYTGKKNKELVEKRIYEGFSQNTQINKQNNHKIQTVYFPEFEAESLQLIIEWEKQFK